MAAYIVTYDLMKLGQNYVRLIEKLKSYPIHWHAHGSVWILETDDDAADIGGELGAVLDGNDKLLVARLSGEASWGGYSDKATRWLRNRLA